MDMKRTQDYYEQLSYDDSCSCAYCQNYIRQIKCEYPVIAEYLQELGIDIENPFETMPLEPDSDGYIEYITAQYIVCGEQTGFERITIDSVSIDIADLHPSTRIEKPHFIIEIYPIRLKWVMPPVSGFVEPFLPTIG